MKTLDENYTYTKWDIYYRREGDTFTIYKTRYKRPTWWPSNISSNGYIETIKLATIYTELQSRFVVSFWTTGYYISAIKWNEDIGLIDTLRVWGQILKIKATKA